MVLREAVNFRGGGLEDTPEVGQNEVEWRFSADISVFAPDILV